MSGRDDMLDQLFNLNESIIMLSKKNQYIGIKIYENNLDYSEIMELVGDDYTHNNITGNKVRSISVCDIYEC